METIQPNIPTRLNNPGDLKDPATGTFRTFSDPKQGYAALLNDLQSKISGTSSTGVNGNSSLYDFAKAYAPSSDKNNPAQYAANLANQLGVRPDTKLSVLQPKIGQFAQAISKNEGYMANVGKNPSQTPKTAPGQAKSVNVAEDATKGILEKGKETFYDPFASRIKDINYGGQSTASSLLQTAGAVVGGGLDVFGKGLMGAAKIVTPEPVQQAVSDVAGGIAQGVSESIPQSFKDKIEQLKKEHPEASANLNAALELASILPAGKAASLFKDVLLIGKGAREAKIMTTAGKIVQGTTEDINPAIRTLKSVSSKGVKTYKELSSKIQEGIDLNLKKVTEELSKDTTGYGLEDFTRSPGKSKELTLPGQKGGITTNYVQNAMNGLKELAVKTKDVELAQIVKDYGKKLQEKTFTKNDVNELAKVWSKNESAFGKSGDMLKGTSAQLRENIRKGLKSLAREGMSSEAKKLDEATSDAIKTKELTDKVSEAVNKEVQRARETGLFTKAISTGVDIADTLSGKIVSTTLQKLARTNVGGLKPSEIESALNKNLKTFQNLVKEGNKEKLKSFLKGIGYGVSATQTKNITSPTTGK